MRIDDPTRPRLRGDLAEWRPKGQPTGTPLPAFQLFCRPDLTFDLWAYLLTNRTTAQSVQISFATLEDLQQFLLRWQDDPEGTAERELRYRGYEPTAPVRSAPATRPTVVVATSIRNAADLGL